MASTTSPATRKRRDALRLAPLLGALAWPLTGHTQAGPRTDEPSPAATAQVTVVGTKTVASIAGFGPVPLASLPMQVDVTTRRADQGPGHPPPVRHRQDRCRGGRRLQRRGLLRLSYRARLRHRQPLQLPARWSADQRRDLDTAGQQVAHRSAQGHQRHARRHRLAWRHGQPGGQAPDRRADPRRHDRLAAERQRARLHRPERPLRRTTRVRPSAECSLRAHRPADLRGRRQPLPAGAGRRLARECQYAAGSRDRELTPLAAQRAGLQRAGLGRAATRQPAHQPEQPALVSAGRVQCHHRLDAPAAESRCAMELGGAGGHPATEEPTTTSPSPTVAVPRATSTAIAATAPTTCTISAARTNAAAATWWTWP